MKGEDFIRFLIWMIFLLICGFALLSIAWAHIESEILIVVLWIGMIVASYAIFQYSQNINYTDDYIGSSARQLIAIILIGTIIRLLWIVIVQPIQLSDFLAYWDSAKRLVNEGQYYYSYRDQYTLFAWRPPGYPLLLAFFIKLFGENIYIPAVINIIAYILSSVAVYLIAGRLYTKKVAIIAVLLLTFWPSHIAVTGLAATEPVVVLLFSLMLWAFYKSETSSHIYAALSGIFLGMAILVKPSFLLLPAIWLLYVVMRWRIKGVFLKFCISILFAVLVVTPWTIRNYEIFGDLVLVSTNGGDVFYRANNPLADGSYMAKGHEDLAGYLEKGEVYWNKKGYELGKKWIMENPIKFISLIGRKQAIFLGADWDLTRWAAKRPFGEVGELYKIYEYVGEIWWALIWVMVTAGLLRNRQFYMHSTFGSVLLLTTMYFIAIHSIFESQNRYHMVMIWLLAILAAGIMHSPRSMRMTYSDKHELNKNSS